MVKLILDTAEGIKGTNILLGLATLDNQTPLARAVCHPTATKELVELLNKSDQIDDRQLLVAFDMVARNRGNTIETLDHLKPLAARLVNYKSQSGLTPLLHIICRHNNKALLEWFYTNIIEVRMKLKYLLSRNDHRHSLIFKKSKTIFIV